MEQWRERFRPTASRLLPAMLAAAGVLVLFAPGSTENAAANGDTRTIHLHHAHTKESIDATYMVDGRYDPVVLEKLNWFLRDWRRDEPTHMDPKLFDVVWEVYRESGSQQPVEVMSAYRSPETNSMLRHATRGVAEHSQHILGKAMDQHYMDVPMSKIRELAMRLQRGGVGFYPTAGTPFVHMDVGGVRHWPRMSYDQLSGLFPDGKTVHIPSNGQPLPGYEMARAELAARGDSFDYPTAGEVKSKGFFAWLFGGSDDDGDGEANRAGAAPRPAAPPARRSAQFANADPVPVGSTAEDGPINSRRDGGAGFFSLFSSRPVAPESPLATAPAEPRPAAVRPAVAAVDPDARAKLAAEMQRQEQAKAAAIEAARPAADAEKQRAVAAEGAPPVDSTSATGHLTAKFKLFPARPPTEAASAGPAVPMPKARPPEMLAASRSDRAPTPPVRGGLPPVLMQGIAASGASPAHMLSFASPAPAEAAPLPVARPSVTAARSEPAGGPKHVAAAVATLHDADSKVPSPASGDHVAKPRRHTDRRAKNPPGASQKPPARVSSAAPHKHPAEADD